MNIVSLLTGLALQAAPAHAQEACFNDMRQDLNCNAISVTDERAVDLTDPTCLAATDDDGNPWPNADYYYDYWSYGCQFPVSDLDVDSDGLGGGTLTYPEGAAYPDLVAVLACDNCPEIPNNDQADLDCDNVGDVCDNCIDIPNNDQRNDDSDPLGTACDLSLIHI